MKKIKFKFTGTLIMNTKSFNVEVSCNDNIKTVSDAINILVEKYGKQILKEIDSGFNIMLTKDNEKAIVVSGDLIQFTELGQYNMITFFYPFTGG